MLTATHSWHDDDARLCREEHHRLDEFSTWLAQQAEANKDNPAELVRLRRAAALVLAERLLDAGRAA